jgi:zinc transport system permease protein
MTLDPLYALIRSLLPFEWTRPDFMLHALLILAMLAPLCGALGVKVVNFRMAFFSDAISHSAFTGVVLGYLLVPLFARAWPGVTHWELILPPITVVLFGVIVAAGIMAVRHRSDLSPDTIIGVFFAAVIALGVAVITNRNLRGDFERYLYGQILTAGPVDVLVALVLALLVLAFMAVAFNPLLLTGLNESLARSRGVRTRLHDYAMAVVLALVVTISIRTVGLLLVTALLVVPAAAARNVARSAGGMAWWAMGIGLVSGVGGLILAYYLETAAGAAIILLASAAFIVTWLAGGKASA